MAICCAPRFEEVEESVVDVTGRDGAVLVADELHDQPNGSPS